MLTSREDDFCKQLFTRVIDFLICQKPQEQGYKGMMALYQSVVLNGEVEPTYYMPIDIITKENYKSYRN